MMEPARLSQVLAGLEELMAALLDVLGPDLFTDGSAAIARPVLALHPRGASGVSAWFSPHRWVDAGAGLRPEISLSAESLGFNRERQAASILHELVHYANWLDGKADAEGPFHHNHHFRERCGRIGLLCEHGGSVFGWAHTRLSPSLRALVGQLPAGPVCRMVRLGGSVEAEAAPTAADLVLRLTDAAELGLVRVLARLGGEEESSAHYLARGGEGSLRWDLGFAEVVVAVRGEAIECRVLSSPRRRAAAGRAA